MRIRRRVRLTSSEMNTTTRQKRPLQTTRRTTSPTWLEPALGLKTPPEARRAHRTQAVKRRARDIQVPMHPASRIRNSLGRRITPKAKPRSDAMGARSEQRATIGLKDSLDADLSEKILDQGGVSDGAISSILGGKPGRPGTPGRGPNWAAGTPARPPRPPKPPEPPRPPRPPQPPKPEGQEDRCS